MDRRKFLSLSGYAALLAMEPQRSLAMLNGSGERRSSAPILGMYVHEGWPYKHPYAARTWSIADWRGYADGLSKLGYNTIIIWPALEIIPDPPTPSDREQIVRTAAVIRMLHREFQFTVFLTLCPNLIAKRSMGRYPFVRRPLFSSFQWVDPSDAAAMKSMLHHREELLRTLAEMDGMVIIDSDPGGYPGSDNAQFAELLDDHRKMLNRLHPDIELYYWMHVGWQAYCDFYATGKFRWESPAESDDILTRLKKMNPAPWGITIHTRGQPPNGTNLQLAEKFGLASTSLAFNYGAIEGEPSFPLTNFGGDAAYQGGAAAAPRGVVGNAQTHCVQIPNTFAFARGAHGVPVSYSDYERLANDLISGQGKLVAESWKTLSESDPKAMITIAGRLDAAAERPLKPGVLQGLLFGSPRRFMTDLAYQLRMRSAFLSFLSSSKEKLNPKAFRLFLRATTDWEAQHGYSALWSAIWGAGQWAGLAAELKKLDSHRIDSILDEGGWMNGPQPWIVGPRQSSAKTPFAKVQDVESKWDTNTTRLIAAMREAARKLV